MTDFLKRVQDVLFLIIWVTVLLKTLQCAVSDLLGDSLPQDGSRRFPVSDHLGDNVPQDV